MPEPPWGSHRPPWWPEDEPFGPGRRHWGPGAGMRGRFLRRMVLGLAVFFAVIFAIGALAVTLAERAFGAGHARPFARVFGLGVVLAFAFLLARRMIRRTAGPIGDVMEAARRVAGGDYGARVDVRGPGDVRRLASAFNEMAERLESNEDRRRRLMADVAHELRTPMTVIRGHAEGALDGVYEPDRAHLARIVEETDLMARLLDDLQTLSMAEAAC
jgi:two-component system sensor histidine kinase BaeS